MGEEVKLYKSWSSLYAWRVAQALKIKEVEYETILEDLTNKSAELLQYNPIHKKVPVLVHNGKPICESLVILEYIDETWKHNPLLPQDPYEKSMARFWAKFGDDKVFPSMVDAFKSRGKEQDEAIAASAENLKYLEEQLKGKKYFGGDNIGYLDIAFGWMVNLTSVAEEVTEKKFHDPNTFPLLSAWMTNFKNDPVIQECWPPHDKMVEKYRSAFHKTVA